MDTPRHEVHGNKGEFFLQEDGRRVAKLTYSMAGDIAIINHTEVDASLRGTGAGNQLVDALVAWAGAHHKRVMPLCPLRDRSSIAPRNTATSVRLDVI